MREFFRFDSVQIICRAGGGIRPRARRSESPALACSPLRSSTVICPRADLMRPRVTSALQRLRHAGAAHAEHQREKFVGERDRVPLVRSCAIRIQRDSRCVDMAARIADRGVGGLGQEGLDVFQHDAVHAGAFCRGRAQGADGNTLAGSAHLHVGLVRRLMIAENDGNAAHALASDQADFDAGLVRLDGDHRGDAGFGKEDVFNLPAPAFPARNEAANRRPRDADAARRNLSAQGARANGFSGDWGPYHSRSRGESRSGVSQSLAPGDRGEW